MMGDTQGALEERLRRQARRRSSRSSETLEYLAADEIASLRARVAVLEGALTLIADRAAKLRAGTDDWFELVEFEMVARQALNTTPSTGEEG